MKYCIAIDGGGTKTDTVLFDETGHILHRYVGKGGNATDIGVEEARRRMCECMKQVFSFAPDRIAAVYGGVAGVLPNGDIYSKELARKFHADVFHFEDDGCNLISGALGHRDGCGMVCGTGSSLFVRVEGQPLHHIGGKGYLIDTGGSGYEIGKEAICMAMRAADGRCRPTVLTQLLAEILGQPVSDAVIPLVHRGGRPYIASFASTVFTGRKMGDWACREIFDRQAGLLADLTFAAEQYFPGDFTVSMGGGIVANFPEYVDAICSKASPRATLVLLKAPPVYGAAVEALWYAGDEASASFKERFVTDYQKLAAQSN